MIDIAIVEDDHVTRESLIAYIEHIADFRLMYAATSAEEGLHVMRRNTAKPDVLLLDIGLPGISGLESIAAFKQAAPDIDIIMFTTFEEEEKIFQALCAGACSYISKKTPLKTIMESIRIVHRGGSYMSPSIARKIAHYFQPKQQEKKAALTNRQMEIVICLVDGLSYKKIANKLNISLDTVRSHIKNIYKVLEVNSSLEVVKKYSLGEI